jgi:hypothetical protein
MSKASEHAARVQAAKNAPAACPGGRGWNIASVTDDGKAAIHQAYLSSEEALKLARWILATFGDDE